MAGSEGLDDGWQPPPVESRIAPSSMLTLRQMFPFSTFRISTAADVLEADAFALSHGCNIFLYQLFCYLPFTMIRHPALTFFDSR